MFTTHREYDSNGIVAVDHRLEFVLLVNICGAVASSEQRTVASLNSLNG